MYIQMDNQTNKVNNSPIKKIVYDKKYWKKNLSWTFNNL
jgi:hypothetical protein